MCRSRYTDENIKRKIRCVSYSSRRLQYYQTCSLTDQTRKARQNGCNAHKETNSMPVCYHCTVRKIWTWFLCTELLSSSRTVVVSALLSVVMCRSRYTDENIKRKIRWLKMLPDKQVFLLCSSRWSFSPLRLKQKSPLKKNAENKLAPWVFSDFPHSVQTFQRAQFAIIMIIPNISIAPYQVNRLKAFHNCTQNIHYD